MRPILHPGLSRTWRDNETLQFGVTPQSARVIGGLGALEVRILRAMDGKHDVSALREIAVEMCGDPAPANHLLTQLQTAGAIIDVDALNVDHEHKEALTSEHITLSLSAGSIDGGTHGYLARTNKRVAVVGSGHVSTTAAELLSDAGIAQVDQSDAAKLRPTSYDLIVLASSTHTYRTEATSLLRLGIPHLLAQVIDVTGIVGPLVIPGKSSCLRCQDMHRCDRDPHWPRVLDQWVREPPPIPASNTALATTVAGLASSQALAFLDGFTPAAVDGTIEIALPTGLPRRRSWTIHPGCGCVWGESESTRDNAASA